MIIRNQRKYIFPEKRLARYFKKVKKFKIKRQKIFKKFHIKLNVFY